MISCIQEGFHYKYLGIAVMRCDSAELERVDLYNSPAQTAFLVAVKRYDNSNRMEVLELAKKNSSI